jgi:hypothetical protein
VIGDYVGELINYEGLTNRVSVKSWQNPAQPKVFDYDLLSGWKPTEPLGAFLDDKGINFFFAQSRIFAALRNDPGAVDLLTRPERVGWERLQAPGEADTGPFLLRRK